MLKIGIKIPGGNLEKGPREIRTTLDIVRDIGFTAVEFTPDSFDLIECAKIDRKNTKLLSTIIFAHGLEPIIHVPLRLNLFNREYPEIHKDVFFASCELCREFGATTLVHHPGRSFDNVDFPRFGKPQRNHTFSQELIEQEKNIIQAAAEHYPDVIIAMENHRPYADFSPYSYAEYCAELAKQVQQIDRPNVRITLDTGHLNLAASYHKLDILKELSHVKDMIAHCHIHDNHGITNFYTDKDKASMLPFGLGDEHTVPGRGTFPFADFLEAMNGYSGIYMVELTGRYFYQEKIKEAYENVLALCQNTEKVV